MQPANITAHRRTLISMHALSERDRKKLFRELTRLSKTPKEQWPEKGVRHLQSGDYEYMLRFTKELVVFFSITKDGQFIIQDILSQRTLDMVAKQLREEEAPEPA
jgi:hypothetical protein